MSWMTPFKIYFVIISLLFLGVGFYEELSNNSTSLNRWVRAKLGHKDLHEYLARESRNLEMPFDDEVPECDYRTMTAKRFFNDYVKQNRPCLFKEYGKLQKAYHLWQNETYLVEQAGDEIIYAERQTDNRFAYFTEGARRVYLPFREFLEKFKEEDRTYHYYYSFEDPPGVLKDDVELPGLMDELMNISIITYWHGYGTLTKPHTDSMENMMCVYEGYKNFTIVPQYDREYIYAGWNGLPDNYSPVEFVAPDLEKWPRFADARVRTAHIAAGDCLFLPAYYWHQVGSSPGVSIGVATFFSTYHPMVDVTQEAL